MKKFAMLALAMSLFLVACGEKKEEEKPAEQPAVEATATEAPAAETTEAAVEAKGFSLKTEDGKEFTDLAYYLIKKAHPYEVPVINIF